MSWPTASNCDSRQRECRDTRWSPPATVYLFQHDHKAGDTNGEGLNAFGGNWFALPSAGDQVTAPPPDNSGGYGY